MELFHLLTPLADSSRFQRERKNERMEGIAGNASTWYGDVRYCKTNATR